MNAANIAALLLLLSATACSSAAGWDRPGFSQAANQRDLQACAAEANDVAARPGGMPSLFEGDESFGSGRDSYFAVDRHLTGDPANRVRDDEAAAQLRDCLAARGFVPNS